MQMPQKALVSPIRRHDGIRRRLAAIARIPPRAAGANAMKRMVTTLALVLGLAGCATSSHVMTGTPRPAITPDQVKVYSAPPQVKYEQIAVIDANSTRAMAITSQQKTDAVIARLKEEAAKLGANAIILQGIATESSGGG